ncbi:MAG: glutamate formimidoyltransferase [Bryobacteraceae bacterium]
MERQLVECVPNFSEGRERRVVDGIADTIASVPGVAVLDRTMDVDHHRSVITFAGPPIAAAEAAVRGVARAVECIDLNGHRGIHPRIGAADVVPFVPLRGVTLEDCAGLAREAAREIWERLRVPVYLYEAAALRSERRRLEVVRRGQFETLREEIRRDPDRLPDFGEGELHPTAGASAIGARNFLVAYNINLATEDLAVARTVAGRIRASSGGLPHVKAMGVPLASRGLAQVSMNLTDFETTGVEQVFQFVKAEAARLGVAIAGGEVIGLVPRQAVDPSAEWFRNLEREDRDVILEDRLERAFGHAAIE